MVTCAIATRRTRLLHTILAPLVLSFIGCSVPDVLHASRCDDVFKKVSLSSLEKACILAGKMPHIAAEVEKARVALEGEGIVHSTSELLDERLENYEFDGVRIDMQEKSAPKAELYVESPEGNKMTFHYGGIENVDGCFIQAEYEQMTYMIRQGQDRAGFYNAASDKKAQFIRALDAQAGKLEKLSMSFTPPFEILMGFADEAEMRQVLESTQHIAIDYYPNPEDAALWVENDIRVTYHLEDKRTVIKFVGVVPLSILK